MPKAVVELDIDCISGLEVFVGRCATGAGQGHGSEVVQCGSVLRHGRRVRVAPSCYYKVLSFATAKHRQANCVLSED